MSLYKLKSGKHLVFGKNGEKKVYLPGDVIDCTERFLHGAINQFEKIGESPEESKEEAVKAPDPKEPKTDLLTATEKKTKKKKSSFSRK